MPAESETMMVATTHVTTSTLGGCAGNDLLRGALALALLLHEPLRERRGAADVVALRVVDAHHGEHVHRLLVAHHLCDRALAQAARDVHDGLDDELVGAVVHARAHELAVDLEVVE